MSSLFLLLLLIVGILPIVATVLAAIALSKANAIEHQTRSLQARLRRLQDHLEAPIERVSRTPAAAQEEEAARSEEPPPIGSVAEEASPPAPVMPLEKPQTTVSREAEETVSSDPLRPPAPPPEAAKPERPSGSRPAMDRIDWEELTGGRLFAWIGGLALFLGILFFVKYSIDQGLLSPAVRVAGSFLLGTACIAGGLRLYSTRYRVIAHTLCAAGPAILYVVVYASYDFYGFIGVTAAFPLMTLVTLVTFLLAVRLDSRYIALLGLLGGFLTPPSLSTGQDRPLALFGYLAFLDLGLVLVALRKRWSFLVPLAAVATALTQIGWTARFFTVEKVVTAVGVQLLFSALFVAAAAAAHRMRVEDRRILAAGAGMPLLSLCMVWWMISFPEVGQRPGLLFSVALLLNLFLSGLVLLRDKEWWPYLAGRAITFSTLLFWIHTQLTSSLLPWGLAFVLIFGTLHAFLAAILKHRRPDSSGLVPTLSTLLPFVLLIAVFFQIQLGDPAPVFGLALLLVVLILGMVLYLRVGAMAMAGLVAVVLLETAWHITGFDSARLQYTVPWYFVFLLIFALFPFALGRRLDKRLDLLPWIASALSGPIHFFLIFDALPVSRGEVLAGVLALAFGTFYLAGLFRLVRTVPEGHSDRSTLLALFASVVLFFVSLAFPVVFDEEWLTVGWALEGLALVWLFGRIPHPGLKKWAFVLLGIAFVRLALNPAVLGYHPRTEAPFLNWYLYAYGTVIICLMMSAHRWRPPEEALASLPVVPALRVMGAVLAFFLLNIEIADLYSQGRHLTFQFGTSVGQDMTYSLAWAGYGLVLLLIGIRTSSRGARFGALGLLAVTIVKLFLYDLWRLGELYRVGAFVGLAMILILVSFLYQRHFGGAVEPPGPGAKKEE